MTKNPPPLFRDLPKGIHRIWTLPSPELGAMWDSIVMDDERKAQLLAQAVVNFTVRPKVARSVLPLHGVILLVGPPGTGKTTLAKGLAHRVAESFNTDKMRLLEVDPHSLTSSSLGKTQKAVSDLFAQAIAESASAGPVIVLLDEVETLAAVLVDSEDNTDYRVMSVDAVPAFDVGTEYEIPDSASGKWVKTDPEVHAGKATAAHQAYSSEWKGLVRMVKYWNNNPKHGSDKPVKPSFLIEVMALECLHGGWGGSFDREIQAFFATLADRIRDDWPDPAGLGPAISNDMDSARKERAQKLLLQASRDASLAIDLARKGRNGDALRAWRDLFGPKFPLS